MKIAIIGTGNVGTALAQSLIKAGHTLKFGVRDKDIDFKGKAFAIEHGIEWDNTAEAVAGSEVIFLCTQGNLAHEVAATLGDVGRKIIIDTMNAVFVKPGNYPNASQAILDNCNCKDVVKCFNTTGFENMADPLYGGEGIDMFVAGDSIKGKEVAIQLAKEIGFGKVWDFGGNDKFNLIEEFAMCWINLAILQKNGRNIGFKVVERS